MNQRSSFDYKRIVQQTQERSVTWLTWKRAHHRDWPLHPNTYDSHACWKFMHIFNYLKTIIIPKSKTKESRGTTLSIFNTRHDSIPILLLMISECSVSTLPRIKIFTTSYSHKFCWLFVHFSLVNFTTVQMNEMEQTRSNPAMLPNIRHVKIVTTS